MHILKTPSPHNTPSPQHTLPTSQLHRVLVDIGPRASDYTRPGQYVQIKVGDDGKPGFFAIASAPDTNNQGVLELLIKNAGEAAEKLCALGAGAQVDASPVQGKGFPIERIPVDSHSTVLMFATGTGISPIKALIESGDIKVWFFMGAGRVGGRVGCEWV